MKSIFVFLIALAVTGCVSQAKIERGNVKSEPIFSPPVNEISTVSLGDRMMFQAFGWNVDCIAPAVSKSETLTIFKILLELRVHERLCGDAEGTNLFRPDRKVVDGSLRPFIVEVSKRDGSSDLCVQGNTSHCVNYQSNEIVRSTEFKSAMNSLQQSIEYMGRDGDVVKFLYIEFEDGMARSAFNREFVMDLTKGSTLNFKGAVVEIIDATNTSLEYRVEEYFN